MAAKKKTPTAKPPTNGKSTSDIRKSPEGLKPSQADLAKGAAMRKAAENKTGPYTPMFPKGTPFKKREQQRKPNKPKASPAPPSNVTPKAPVGKPKKIYPLPKKIYPLPKKIEELPKKKK